MTRNKTVLDLRKMKAENDKIVMVTAYDYTMARLVDAAGVDMVLVGDSLGMVVQGAQDTTAVTLENMLYHSKCVRRGLKTAHLVGDLPFMAYQVSPEQALTAAGRMIAEGRAQSVKLEGGMSMAKTISRIVAAGIPVVGHVGLTPQSVHAMGGFRVQGRREEDADRIIQDALAVQDAGAFCVVLEGIPSALAAEITNRLDIFTIGIGAGPVCGGQVLVSNDLLGMDQSFKPKFVRRFANLEESITGAVGDYRKSVKDGSFPGPEHQFHAKRPARLAKLY